MPNRTEVGCLHRRQQVPNESKRKRLTLNLMLMQNPADAKSYRSWLPPSSGPASRARLLANKASSSSSKSPKLKPMPKQRAKSAMERRNGPIWCKCLPKAPFQLEASGMWSVFQRCLQLSYGKPHVFRENKTFRASHYCNSAISSNSRCRCLWPSSM